MTSLAIALAVLAGLPLAGAAGIADASASVPPGACGSVLLAGGSWLNGAGVDVKSNGPDEGEGASCGGTNSVNGITTGREWQCVELVNRLYASKGWITSTWHGNGGDSSSSAHDSMYDKAPGGLSKQPNGSINSVGPGDVVSINEYYKGNFLADGHVLIVNTSGSVTSGTVQLVSQNSGSPSGANPQRTATLNGGTLSINAAGDYSYSVIGVVHAPTSDGGGGTTPFVHKVDFNGDGKTDVLFPTKSASGWLVKWGGSGPWVTLSGSQTGIDALGFGDFNGDGKTDVLFPTKSASGWLVKWRGSGSWAKLSSSQTGIESLSAHWAGNGYAFVH